MKSHHVPVHPGSVFFLVLKHERSIMASVRKVAVHLFNEDDLKSIQSPLEPRSSNLIGGGLYWQ